MRPPTGLQNRFGFTRNEIRAMVFLSVTFVVGAGIRWYRHHAASIAPPDGVSLDYSLSDSEFVARSRTPLESPLLSLSPGAPVPPGQRTGPQSERVDLNTADADQLVSLPGIGAEFAARIISYRKAHGPFRSVDGLARVKGIGKKRLERLRPFVTIR